MNKIGNRVLAILSFSPFIFLIVFYSFILRVALKFGKWPTENHPDPELTGFDKHHQLAIACFAISVAGILLFALMAAILKYIGSLNLSKVYWRILVVGIILVFLLFLLDPTIGWSLD
jgi:hypothetical protein